jgi:hypothetical protein
MIKQHYSTNFTLKYNPLDETVEFSDAILQEKHEEKIAALYLELREEYNRASLSYINCLPPNILKNPIKGLNVITFNKNGLDYSPLIRIRIAYFEVIDWISIVERDIKKVKMYFKASLDSGRMQMKEIEEKMKNAEIEDLIRVESDKVIWESWLYSYINFGKTNNHVFRLFENELPTGLVYLIRQRNTNYFKIGWTENKKGFTEKQSVENRISSLQTGNPNPLDIVGFFRASSTKTEKTVHSIFALKRQTGEWFLLNDSDCQNILDDNWRINNNVF